MFLFVYTKGEVIQINQNTDSKFVSNCSKAGAITGVGCAVAYGIKNKQLVMDTFTKATKSITSKPLKTILGAGIGALALAGAAFDGSVLGNIADDLTEKILNLFKKEK